MTDAEKQLAVDNFILWLRRKYAKKIMKLALQYKIDIDVLGKRLAKEMLNQRTKGIIFKKQ